MANIKITELTEATSMADDDLLVFDDGMETKSIKKENLIPTVDQTYDGTSPNAQSGTALNPQFNAKQNTLVSGTNIKTINNQSLLGGGDISTAGIHYGIDTSNRLATINNGTNYTATQDCWACPGMTINNDVAYFYIDGKEVCTNWSGTFVSFRTCVFVKQGQVIRATGQASPAYGVKQIYVYGIKH